MLIVFCVRCFVANEGFGLASHLGVLSGIPCVGVGKKLFHVDGLERNPAYKDKVCTFCAYIQHQILVCVTKANSIHGTIIVLAS